MNSLQNLAEILDSGKNEIHVSADLARRARIPIQRMLEFTERMNR
jgi:quinolinate synthase